jgi:hypothetical protein
MAYDKETWRCIVGYRFRLEGKKAWSKEYGDEDWQKALATRMAPRQSPFRFRELWGEFGPWRARVEARRRLVHTAEGSKVGDVFEIENERGWRMRMRHTDSGIALARPPWGTTYLGGTNDRIDKVACAAYAFDEAVDCLGSKVCKRISGSTSWSQHAYGNAIDLGFRVPPPTGFDMARQDRLAAYLVANADELALEHVIHRDHAWTRGAGWGSYGGEYHTHVHVDATPQGAGYPPGC